MRASTPGESARGEPVAVPLAAQAAVVHAARRDLDAPVERGQHALLLLHQLPQRLGGAHEAGDERERGAHLLVPALAVGHEIVGEDLAAAAGVAAAALE